MNSGLKNDLLESAWQVIGNKLTLHKMVMLLQVKIQNATQMTFILLREG